MSIESISFHSVLLIRLKNCLKQFWVSFFFLLFEMSLCGETFSRLFTIGLSQICLWISITVKWIFCEAASTGHANYLLIR